MSAVLLHEGGDKVGYGGHAGDHLYILSESRSPGSENYGDGFKSRPTERPFTQNWKWSRKNH